MTYFNAEFAVWVEECWHSTSEALLAAESGVPSTNPPSCCGHSPQLPLGWSKALCWGGSTLAMAHLGESMPDTGTVTNGPHGAFPHSHEGFSVTNVKKCSSKHHVFIALLNLTSSAFYKYLSKINSRANLHFPISISSSSLSK